MLVALFRVEMAETEDLSVPDGQTSVAQSTQNAPALPSAGSHSVLQERLSLAALDHSEGVVQPFPRSPKLQKKVASAGQPSQVMTSERCERFDVLPVKFSKTIYFFYACNWPTLCAPQEQLSRHLDELQAERSKTEAHIKSLKKRKADYSVSIRPTEHQQREKKKVWRHD